MSSLRGFTGTRAGVMQKNKRSAKELFMQKLRGEDENRLSPEERYQKIFEKKLEEMRVKAMSSTKFGVMLPGTEGSENKRELSDSAKEIIEKLAREKAKKMAKKMTQKKEVKIVAKYFSGTQGGRIDHSGYIYGPDGAWVGTVDKKSGRVKSKMGGFTICKYNPKSSYCEFRITQWIAGQYRQKQSGASVYGVDGHNAAGPAGVWGAPGPVGDGGVWGNNDDDQTGGFWG